MLVLMLAEGYFSSKAFSGDFFFMRYCLLYSSLLLFSCFVTLGDSTGEFFMESFMEVFAVVEPVWPELLQGVLKLMEAVPKPEELRMDWRRPNWAVPLGLTPGA